MAFVSAVACALVTREAAAGEDVGFVLELMGRWQVEADGAAPHAVVAGQAVKSGDKLTMAAPDSRLTVVMLDGSRVVCPSDARCAAPLGKKPAPPGLARRFVRAIGGLFGSPERYATTMSRGEELHESVGIINDSQQGARLHLGKALEALPPGSYRVTIERLGAEGKVAGAPFTVDIGSRSHGKDAMPRSGDLKPGLYRISLESGADAWVLLASVDAYRHAVGMFAEAQRIAGGFGKEVPARAVRSFLRAALDAIARGDVDAPDDKTKAK